VGGGAPQEEGPQFAPSEDSAARTYNRPPLINDGREARRASNIDKEKYAHADKQQRVSHDVGAKSERRHHHHHHQHDEDDADKPSPKEDRKPPPKGTYKEVIEEDIDAVTPPTRHASTNTFQPVPTPAGMIRREPVPFSAIGRNIMAGTISPSNEREHSSLSTVRGYDVPPQRLSAKQLSKEPIATAVTDEQVDEENNNKTPIAVAFRASQVNLRSRKLWVCLALVMLAVCGAIAGAVVALAKRNDPPSSALPFTPLTPLPPSSPTPAPQPIDYMLQQLGQSLVQESDIDGTSSTGPRGELYFGWSVDLSSDGQRLVATSPYFSTAYIYDLEGDSWIQTFKITDEEGGFVDHIALSGNAKVLAVGMPGNDDVNLFGGKVQVYEEMSGLWQKRGNPIFGQGIGDLIGGVYMEETGEYPYNDTDRTGNFEFSTESFDSSSMALSDTGHVLAVGSSTGNYVQVYTYENATSMEAKEKRMLENKPVRQCLFQQTGPSSQ